MYRNHYLILILSLCINRLFAQTFPPGFSGVNHVSGFSAAVGFTFDDSGRMFVWEKDGTIWPVLNGTKAATPMISIREEVNSSEGDLGLLGVALDPQFLQNGNIYLSYAVDRHHLLYFGTPGYNPAASETGATIVRVSRFSVNPNTLTLVPNSRKVLIGESKSTGIPSLYNSHTGGGISFGKDGTLLIATGDGASATVPDYGGEPSTYYQQGLDDGIITGTGNGETGPINRNHENIGAYRAQNLYSLAGKLLRIDPNTGDGIPSNPYYNAASPRSPQSRIFALGLRNPFRISRREGTGSTNPADGNPGSIYIGNVGWNQYEEINVLKTKGENFGWPLYEGINNRLGLYAPLNEVNYPYRVYPLPNPNSLPKIDFSPSRARMLLHGTAQLIPQNTGLPYTDITKGGTCVIDVGWSSPTASYPAEYQDRYFFANYSPTASWIAYAQFDANDNPLAVKTFAGNFIHLVHLAFNPVDKNLYYLTDFNEIKKIVYGGNQSPLAFVSVDKTYGPSALTVAFDGTASRDPESTSLTYSWNFGDNTPPSTLAEPTHTFTAIGVRTYTVTLTVTDAGGASAQTTQLISVNNTPPVIESTSLDNVTTINPTTASGLTLSAVVTDAQHSAGQLAYSWVVSLMHNDHGHSQAPLNTPTASVTLAALGECNRVETFWYRVALTVTDAGGLATTTFRDLYPNCGGVAQTITFPAIADQLPDAQPFRPQVSAASGLPVSLYIVNGPAFIENGNVRLTGGLGTVTVRAAQAGDATYRPARVVEQSFQVLKSLPPVASGADLSLELVFGNLTVLPNNPVSLSMIVRNEGPDPATDIRLLSRLPTGLAFLSSPDLSHNAGVVSATLNGPLESGQMRVYQMLVSPTQLGTYLLAAQINASGTSDPDSQPGSGTGDGQDDMAVASVSTWQRNGNVFVSPNPDQVPLPPLQSNQPIPEAGKVDLSLQLAVSNRVPQAGQMTTFTITVRNQGSVTASNVVIRDTLRGLTFDTSSNPSMSIVGSGSGFTVLSGAIPSIAPGESASLVFRAVLSGNVGLRNAAQIWSVGTPGPASPADSDSQPGNGTTNGEDDAAWIDLRVNRSY